MCHLLLLVGPVDFQFYYYIVASIIVGISALLVIVEIFLSLNDIPGDNINLNLYKWATNKWYFITFMWGVIAGHLFLGSTQPWIAKNMYSVIIIGLITIALIIKGKYDKNESISQSTHMFLLVIGTLLGHFLWSMNDFDV